METTRVASRFVSAAALVSATLSPGVAPSPPTSIFSDSKSTTSRLSRMARRFAWRSALVSGGTRCASTVRNRYLRARSTSLARPGPGAGTSSVTASSVARRLADSTSRSNARCGATCCTLLDAPSLSTAMRSFDGRCSVRRRCCRNELDFLRGELESLPLLGRLRRGDVSESSAALVVDAVPPDDARSRRRREPRPFDDVASSA
mmetsp:Transcript_18530/g.32163  ORF Transcript_18530/g.32163 Transcript_18530/m.32163 type:complete len:204 (+) Transcript_18530:684-1295(+)